MLKGFPGVSGKWGATNSFMALVKLRPATRALGHCSRGWPCLPVSRCLQGRDWCRGSSRLEAAAAGHTAVTLRRASVSHIWKLGVMRCGSQDWRRSCDCPSFCPAWLPILLPLMPVPAHSSVSCLCHKPCPPMSHVLCVRVHMHVCPIGLILWTFALWVSGSGSGLALSLCVSIVCGSLPLSLFLCLPLPLPLSLSVDLSLPVPLCLCMLRVCVSLPHSLRACVSVCSPSLSVFSVCMLSVQMCSSVFRCVLKCVSPCPPPPSLPVCVSV